MCSLESTSKSTGVVLVVAAVAVFVIAAVVAGVFLLKRVKRKTTDPDHPVAMLDKKQKRKQKQLSAKMLFSSTTRLSSDLTDPLQDTSSKQRSFRKNTFKDIPSSHVQLRGVVATNGGLVCVSDAEYNKNKRVLVAQLQLNADAAENCEMALDVVPVVSQLRHPQLLSVLGLMYEDTHPVTAVCEFMDLGTLETHLQRNKRELTWHNFKLRAALDIAGCLMYLHTKHKLSYGALNGKSVFVDEAKGCKLNTLLASVPEDVVMLSRLADLGTSSSLATRGFLAPEILAGEPCRSSSDMFAFGALLAQLDRCFSADEVTRQLRSTPAFSSSSSSSSSGSGLENSQRSTTTSQMDEATSSAMTFPFSDQCPPVVKELATACLQFDPSLRPSASYVVAMLQQLC